MLNEFDLPALFGSRPEVIELKNKITSFDSSKVMIKQTAGSSMAIIAAALQSVAPRSLFILPDKEAAAYFHNDLEQLLGEEKCLLFPASTKKILRFDEPDQSAIQQRAEALDRLNRNTQLHLVTYPEALAEKVISKQALKNSTIEVRVGELIDTEFITEFLQAHQFEHTDFVVQPGEFAIRGGIVDIYSYANELPYRLELMGNEVESIRTFDPVTQLSVAAMNHIAIMPNVQARDQGLDYISLIDFFASGVPIFAHQLKGALQHWKAAILDAKQKSNNENVDRSIDERYDADETLIALLQQKKIIEWGTQSFFSPDTVITFSQQPQPSFNKNFSLLLNSLVKNKNDQYTTYLLCDNSKQLERLQVILDDVLKNEGIKLKLPASWQSSDLYKGKVIGLHEGFVDHQAKIACYTDHQIFDRYHRFKLRKSHTRSESITIKELYALKPGDFVTHIDHGVGKFAGLETIDVNGKQQEAVRLVYKDNDILYVSIHSLHRIAKYTGKDGSAPSLHKLGSTTWSTLKQKTKKKVKDIATELISLYAKRRSAKGFAFMPDTYLQNELEASFMYEDTPDQYKATIDVKRDMEKPFPMDRLVCGDVGFGKTEVALRAAFKAVTDGKQVAVLVPTTILALQHYKTFKERLKQLPCTIDYINRFKSSASQKETLQLLSEGKIDIIVGTHKLLGKEVQFKDLGLMIIDEEQKFGVAAKEKLKSIRVNVDTLTLTATPIPRTLQFSLMGARDLSIINTPPANRYPVTTELHVFNDQTIKDAIMYEVSRGGQVFFIHNRVSDIQDMATMLSKLCPTVSIGVGHGQMSGDALEEVMLKFIEGDFDVLVSTTIIESGLDIPNANTILINQAQNFGLSDMHQMRGRVGRSNKKAFCYLLTPPTTVLTNEARQRLKAIEEFSDLGSGFNVAMRDLDIRGAGNMLGGEQSGFISEIGFEMYHKILDEALQELKETSFSDLFSEEIAQKPFVYDCQIETDLEIRLPHSFVNSQSERLLLYKELDSLKTEDQLQAFEIKLKDRFGPLPLPAVELLATIRLRWLAEKLGLEKLLLKHQRLIAYFVSNQHSHYYQSETFSTVLKFVQRNPHQCKLKEEKGKLSITFKQIDSIKKANQLLSSLHQVAIEKVATL
jgi:transcription-repair coupling factor (superfamily II helicase)